eukprot:evm.model.scf_2381.3 EVM.evm.TU.scf_2381.3   scf_2381:22648-24275(+)
MAASSGKHAPPDSRRASLLSEYDAGLLLDRYYVPIPRDGFADEDEAVGDEAERFQPIRTTWIISLYSLLLLAYIVTVFVTCTFAHDLSLDKTVVSAEVVAATAHVPLLVLAGVMEGFIRLQHRRRQSLGYLQFYRETRRLLPIPFQTSAYSGAAMLLVVAWYRQASPGQVPKLAILMVALVEATVMGVFDYVYISRVRKHNRTETLPDAQKYLESAVTTANDTRRRVQDAVVEHQVEFIRYLQTQRNNLAGEVFRLRELLESGGKDGDAPLGRDDAEHLLAAGEQRQRALRAETDTLKRENESAWKLMAEKVEEIHRLKDLLEGQRKENVRLRATLEEWSRRNAKLEHRLNRAAEQLRQAGSGAASDNAR